MAKPHFEPDPAGIQEIFKSSEMQGALQEAADDIAADACDAASFISRQGFKEAPYRSKVKVLDGTAIGIVSSVGVHGAKFDAKWQVLAAQNH